jgi:hypothetical protein
VVGGGTLGVVLLGNLVVAALELGVGETGRGGVECGVVFLFFIVDVVVLPLELVVIEVVELLLGPCLLLANQVFVLVLALLLGGDLVHALLNLPLLLPLVLALILLILAPLSLLPPLGFSLLALYFIFRIASALLPLIVSLSSRLFPSAPLCLVPSEVGVGGLGLFLLEGVCGVELVVVLVAIVVLHVVLLTVVVVVVLGVVWVAGVGHHLVGIAVVVVLRLRMLTGLLAVVVVLRLLAPSSPECLAPSVLVRMAVNCF